MTSLNAQHIRKDGDASLVLSYELVLVVWLGTFWSRRQNLGGGRAAGGGGLEEFLRFCTQRFRGVLRWQCGAVAGLGNVNSCQGNHILLVGK